jgi:hypothetical protein
MLAAGPISRTNGMLNWCGVVVSMNHTIDPSVAARFRFSSSGTDTTVHRITVLVVRTASGRRLILRGFLIRRDVDDADRRNEHHGSARERWLPIGRHRRRRRHARAVGPAQQARRGVQRR